MQKGDFLPVILKFKMKELSPAQMNLLAKLNRISAMNKKAEVEGIPKGDELLKMNELLKKHGFPFDQNTKEKK